MGETHEVWQTALLVVAYIAILVFGGLLYWWTSEAYKIRQVQKKLGYKVPSTWSSISWCCFCCTGPLLRSSWEKENMYYRSDEYAVLKKKRKTTEQLMKDNGKWMDLPRGDVSRHKSVIKAAITKIRARIIQAELEQAIETALKNFSTTGQAGNRDHERQVERIRAAAARWRGMAPRDLHLQREKEIEAMINESDSGSSDDDVGNFGCDVSFIKLHHQPAPKKTVRLPGQHPPAAKPMVMGAWGNAGGAPVVTQHGQWGESAGVQIVKGPRTRVQGSRALSIKELKAIVRDHNPQSLAIDFDTVSVNWPRPETLAAGNKRYTANVNIFPFPESRVRLVVNNVQRYINASYLRGPDGTPEAYIGTQVPLKDPDNRTGKMATAGDFWMMILTHECPAIVLLDSDLTPYWPVQENYPHDYGTVTVSLQSDFHGKDFNEVVLNLSQGRRSHRVSLLIFHPWRRDGLPEASSLLALVKFVNIIARREESGPIVFQDWDGGDRVGTAIAIDHIMFQIKRSGVVDIKRTIANVREDRGGMISQPNLYWLLHNVACTYALAIGAGPSPPSYMLPPTMDGKPR